MKKHWLATLSVIGAFLFGAALQKGNTTVPDSIHPTVVVAKINLPSITTSVPLTTVFTPSATGVFRVSTYMAQTSVGDGLSTWNLDWFWTDTVGAEEYQGMTWMISSNVPPSGYGTLPSGYAGAPFVFGAIAGQSVSFQLRANGSGPGTAGLSIIVERLE